MQGLWQYIVDTTHPLNPLLTDEAAQAGKPTLKADVQATIDKLGFEASAAVTGAPPPACATRHRVTFVLWAAAEAESVECGAGQGRARGLRHLPGASCCAAWRKRAGLCTSFTKDAP